MMLTRLLVGLVLLVCSTSAFAADGVFTNLRATNARFTNMSAVSVKSHGVHTGSFVGSIIGPVTGNVTGNLTGNVTGNLTGNVTGDILGTCYVPTSITTLEEARTTNACLGKTVVVTTAITEAQSNITAAWPADRALKIEKGGSIANSADFTINSPFSAGLHQVFAGTGGVTFGAGFAREAYPEWWGEGLIDANAPVKAACNSLVNSKGSIIFTKTYNFQSGYIFAHNGVNLIGRGGKLYRKYKYDTNNQPASGGLFILFGNNLVEGLWYDGGGWDANVYPGVQSNNYTYYSDFCPQAAAENITFSKNTFNNSGGSFITSGGQNLKIINNTFNDWKDHSVYIGNSTATKWDGYIVSGNHFEGLQTVNPTFRDALKFKGNLDNINITNNTFHLPLATVTTSGFINVSAVYNTEFLGKVVISGNVGDVANGCFVALDTNSSDVRYLDTVLINNNAVTATYMIIAGSRPSDVNTQNGMRIKNLSIVNNNFRGVNGWLINGRDGVGHDGIEFMEVRNNTIELMAGSYPYFMGNLKVLIIDNNTFKGATEQYAFSFGYAGNVGYHWHPGTINLAFVGHASITNNTLININRMIDDVPDASNPSAIGLDIYLSGNKFVGVQTSTTLRSFIHTSLSYPPATTLTVGPDNYVAPRTGDINEYTIIWAGPRREMGVATRTGYRSFTGLVESLAVHFLGEEVFDSANGGWYKSISSGPAGGTSNAWVKITP